MNKFILQSIYTQPIVKCSNWETRINPDPFAFASYIYLHRDAQDLCGYDCMEGNLIFFSKLNKNTLRVVDLLTEDGTLHKALLVTAYREAMIQGLVCLLSDVKGINHALNDYFHTYVNASMYEDEQDFLKDNYPDVYREITSYRRKT